MALLAGPLVWLIMALLGVPVQGTREPGVLLLGIVIYPLLEEIVFRLGLQASLAARFPALRQSRWGISLANIVVALLFASLHLINRPPAEAAWVILPALVFGWAWDRYASLWQPVLLHALYNAGYLWFFAAA